MFRSRPGRAGSEPMKHSRRQESHVKASQRARGLKRRQLIQSVGAIAAGALGLFPLRGTRSSSGELRLLHWSDELPYPIISDFEGATGIKVISIPFSSNEEQIKILRNGGVEKFDLCQPMHHLAPQLRDTTYLGPIDTKALANLGNYIPAMLERSKSIWSWDGGLYYVPHCWGSEGISWRTDLAKVRRDSVSYATLWQEEFRGKVQAHPDSLLLGLGLWLDYRGQVPSNRMADAFKNPDSMRRIYDEIVKVAIDKKPWIAAYWTGPYEIKAHLQSGATIGQTWDGPALALKKEGKPVDFIAPTEGAIVWFSGWSLTAGAKNREQAYAWLDYLSTPEVSATLSEGSGYNPVVNGAAALLSDAARRNFAEAFPGDALDQLWYRIPEQTWFAELRDEYLWKLRSA